MTVPYVMCIFYSMFHLVTFHFVLYLKKTIADLICFMVKCVIYLL